VDRSELREWLRGEISKWTSEGIIDDLQAETILSRYDQDFEPPIETPAEVEAEDREKELLIEETAEPLRPQFAVPPERILEEEILKAEPEEGISEEREEQLTSRYDLSGILPEDRASRLIFVITLLGSILLGGGAILFVASNWNAIPQLVRFLLLFGVTLGTYFLGWRLSFQTRSHPKAGHALLFLASIFVGATIFLTAQIFNVNADVHWLILFWFLAISPMGYGFHSRPIMGLCTFTFILWVFVYLMTGWLLEAFMLYLVMGICFYGIGAIHSASQRYPQFRSIYQAVGLFFILTSYFYFSIETPRGFETSGMDWPFKAFFLLLSVGAFATMLISIFKRDRFGMTWEESSLLILAFLGWAAALFLNLFWGKLTVIEAGRSQLNPEAATPLFFLFNMGVFLLALGAVMIGDRKEEDLFVGLGAVFIGLETIHLLGEEAFIICLMMGVVLYGLSISFGVFEKRSRLLASYQVAGLSLMLATFFNFSSETDYISELAKEGLSSSLIILLMPLLGVILCLLGIFRIERLRMVRGEFTVLLLTFIGWIAVCLLALFWDELAAMKLKPDLDALIFAFFSLVLFALSLEVILIGDRRSEDIFIKLGALFFAILILHIFIQESFTLYLLIGLVLYSLVLFYIEFDGGYRFVAEYRISGLFLILGYYLYLIVETINELDIMVAIRPFKLAFFLVSLAAFLFIVRAFRKRTFETVRDELSILFLALLGWIVIGLLALFWDELAAMKLKPDLDTVLFIFFSLVLFLIAVATILAGDRRFEYGSVGLGSAFIGLEMGIILLEERLMLYLLMGAFLYSLGLYCAAFERRLRSRILYQIAGLSLMLAYYLYLSLETTYQFEIFESDFPFKVAFLIVPLAAVIVTLGVSRKERFRSMLTELSLLALAFLGWIVIGFIALFWIKPSEVPMGLSAEMNVILFAIFNLLLFAQSFIAIVIGYRRSIDAFIGLGLIFIGAEILNLFKEEFMFVLLLMGIAIYALGIVPIISEKFLRFRANYQIIGLFLMLTVYFYFSLKRTYFFEIFEADWFIKGIFFFVPLIAAIVIVGASRKEKFGKLKYDLTFLMLAFLGWIVVGALALYWPEPAIAVPGRAELISELNTILFIFFNLVLLSLCVSSIAIGYFKSNVPFVNLGLLFFVFGVLHIYFTTVYAYLPRSLALIVGGIILLVGGWRLEKVRRSLIEKMDLETTKDDVLNAEIEKEPGGNDERR